NRTAAVANTQRMDPSLPRLLLCADPFLRRTPDSAFASETSAIEALGWPFDLLDLEALLGGDAPHAIRRLIEGRDSYLYRGWMLAPARYEALGRATAARGASLVTPPDASRAAHQLPGWYAAMSPATPRSVWIGGQPPFDVGAIHAALAPF